MYQVKGDDNENVYIVFLDESEGTSRKHIIYSMKIENGQLNRAARHFKSKIGVMSEMTYSNEVKDYSISLDAKFDESTQSIMIPVLKMSGKAPEKYSTLKFNGNVFEKSK